MRMGRCIPELQEVNQHVRKVEAVLLQVLGTVTSRVGTCLISPLQHALHGLAALTICTPAPSQPSHLVEREAHAKVVGLHGAQALDPLEVVVHEPVQEVVRLCGHTCQWLTIKRGGEIVPIEVAVIVNELAQEVVW